MPTSEALRERARDAPWRWSATVRRPVRAPRLGSLHVLEVFQPQVGGVPEYVTALVEGLVGRGVQVSVACPPAAGLTRRLRAVGAEVLAIEVDRRPHPRRDALAVGRLERWCAVRGVSVLHGHSTKAGLLVGLAGARAGVPSLYTPHCWSFEQLVSPAARAAYALYERQLVRRCHHGVLAASASSREAAVRWRVAPRERVTVVATGVPSPLPVGRESARAQLGLGPDAMVAAWVGRHADQKRPRDLVAAARALAGEVTLVALCTGVHGTELEKELRAAGIVVADPGTEPAVAYAASDMLIKTSGWEDASLVIVEAMSAGLPVVSYDVGGVGEQVRAGRTGYLVAAGDVAMLCECVRSLASRPDLRARMGDAARSRVQQRFPYEGMIDKVLTAYAEAAGVELAPRRRIALDARSWAGGGLTTR